jgi:3',5'-cyclic AMP phosphodiesterase CpdA
MTGKTFDPIDRRGLLKCMAWAGTGSLFLMNGGIASSMSVESAASRPPRAPAAGFSFVQISDSHIGFDRPANPDPHGTLVEAVAKIRALPVRPDFVLHTGDVSHLSREAEFAEAEAVLQDLGVPVFYIPGEHDTLDDQPGTLFHSRFGAGTQGAGWYSFDHQGVHFVGLVNVVNLAAGGMGHLGAEQLGWLRGDLAALSASTPLVVFAHIPLWTVYGDWGWGTDDSLQALALMRRFGSVLVLNGHIHQVIEKVEGNITFHTARSTAYPQPAPGAAPTPGPLTVPAGELRHVLGIRTATVTRGAGPVALVDAALA